MGCKCVSGNHDLQSCPPPPSLSHCVIDMIVSTRFLEYIKFPCREALSLTVNL